MSRFDECPYQPDPKPTPVVTKGEFPIAAAHLDHPHIYGMCQALEEAGANVTWVYDSDEAKVAEFLKLFPQAKVARSEEEVLSDPAVKIVAGAAVTSERADLGIRVMGAGKDYFTDKAPLTTLDQLARAKESVERTGQKYAVYYSERINVESAVFAGQLIERGVIGRVLQVLGLGPHRLGQSPRPAWFFEKEKYGGILCDIGSHNIEQVLWYSGASDAEIRGAAIANYAHPQYPELDDFGECSLLTNTGASGYFRVDWFTPDGLQNWGDGRMFVLGTEGYIEQRKYLNVGTDDGPGNVFVVNGQGEWKMNVSGKVGTPYFGRLILDCLNRTETAMTQVHAFKAAELSVKAQLAAQVVPTDKG
ncbi:MAG: Gfo/Idh/MocA family oxidoreductase [Propionibacteriaceae bacterium]|jgi:predicted dehydrogenase|nr:Gfo/Idh/MocA family oxidoreductase [Propionibacteriaceae bacterium]